MNSRRLARQIWVHCYCLFATSFPHTFETSAFELNLVRMSNRARKINKTN